MTTYDILAKYYDEFVPDPSVKAAWLQGQITKHRPNTQSVLELACGTGTLLKYLESYRSYKLTGLDQSPEMLKVAKHKLPSATFVQGDMSDFTLGQQSDVVLCIYDSMNHLLQFKQWESLFEHVAIHLNENGLFIFDMNTVKKLKELDDSNVAVTNLGSARIEMADITKGATPAFHIKIYEDDVLVGEEHIPEVSFEIDHVERALRKNFRILEVNDPEDNQPPYGTGKIYFVCQKLA